MEPLRRGFMLLQLLLFQVRILRIPTIWELQTRMRVRLLNMEPLRCRVALIQLLTLYVHILRILTVEELQRWTRLFQLPPLHVPNVPVNLVTIVQQRINPTAKADPVAHSSAVSEPVSEWRGVQEVRIKQIVEHTTATATESGINNRVVNDTEMGPGPTTHPIARVHEGAGVGVALTVMVPDLYMSRLGTLRGLFAPSGWAS
jgi:hypothetical protein